MFPTQTSVHLGSEGLTDEDVLPHRRTRRPPVLEIGILNGHTKPETRRRGAGLGLAPS